MKNNSELMMAGEFRIAVSCKSRLGDRKLISSKLETGTQTMSLPHKLRVNIDQVRARYTSPAAANLCRTHAAAMRRAWLTQQTDSQYLSDNTVPSRGLCRRSNRKNKDGEGQCIEPMRAEHSNRDAPTNKNQLSKITAFRKPC